MYDNDNKREYILVNNSVRSDSSISITNNSSNTQDRRHSLLTKHALCVRDQISNCLCVRVVIRVKCLIDFRYNCATRIQEYLCQCCHAILMQKGYAFFFIERIFLYLYKLKATATPILFTWPDGRQHHDDVRMPLAK